MVVMHEPDHPKRFRSRCIGFYHELETAIKAVQENSLDMREEEYPLALVEKRCIGPYGVGSGVDNLHWFRWNKDTEKFEKCETPKGYENTIGFGMG